MEKRYNKHIYTWVGTFLFGLLGVDRFMRGQILFGILKILAWPLSAVLGEVLLLISYRGVITSRFSFSYIFLYGSTLFILLGYVWFLIDFVIALTKLGKYEKEFVFEDKKWSAHFIKKVIKAEKTEEDLKFEFFMKNLIRGGALLLCVLFFTLPLVQCSRDSSYTASGWEIATGTGKIYDNSSSDGYPFALLLIIIPVVLIIASFVSNSFAVLRNVSIAGLLAKIIFLISVNSMINSSENRGALELTGYNYLVLFLYIGLCAISFYCCIKNKNISLTTKKCPFCANAIRPETVFCQFCGKEIPKAQNST